MTITYNGNIHPAAALFPMIPADELQLLADDIATSGLHHPVVLAADGTLVDGRNRLAACKLAGVDPTFTTYTGDEIVAFIVGENIRRRHLTTGQAALVALDLLPLLEAAAKEREAQRKSNNVTVADLPQSSPAKSRDQAAKMVGTSGRAVGQAKRVATVPELADKVRSGELALDRADQQVRIAKAKSGYLTRQATWDRGANSSGERWEILHGDFRDALVDLPDGSVDAIITDPPYPDEFLPLWGDLAKMAERVLRPGAPLIAYTGQYRIKAVLDHLTGPLTYQWMLNLELPGSNARFRGPNMIQTWKPVVICTAGTWGAHDWFRDRVTSPAKDQELYEWQQNPDPVAELIRRYVPEGGLVLDPFAGVGSFGVAALSTGRRFLGVEMDDERHMTACERVGGT